ncbi:MAG: hypothetical protein II685_00005 [Clostridia bacterium]|nr:hypothetical protein [Clostridia bacterium]
MSKIGSPEWFNEKGRSMTRNRMPIDIERMRASFCERFSPDALSKIDGNHLLRNVFGNSDSCMIRLLMFDDSYRWFGAAGKYVYLGVLYNKKETGAWTYKEGSRAVDISYSDAEEKAEYIRDKLLECINCIVRIGCFTTIYDYEKLDKALSKVFFSKYTWTLKYYQMLFPHIFPGMYADDTINRALSILGLPDHGNRILNMGEIALFIRRCDMNNIVFNTAYDDQWTWRGSPPPCESASDNFKYAFSKVPVINDNLSYYKIPQVENIAVEPRETKPIIPTPVPKIKEHFAKKAKTEPVEKPQDDFVMPVLYEGLKVKHSKYGEGIITAISKDEKQITVSFADCDKGFCSGRGEEMNAFRKGYLTIIEPCDD